MPKPLPPAAIVARVEQRILAIRGQRVLLDSDLAALYGVEVRTLVQAVKRNADRFPADFLFRLGEPEWRLLRSQTVILDAGRGRHRKYLPYAFTEQGVAMLSSVLRTRRAALVNVEIMRTFVRLRRLVAADTRLANRLAALERRMVEQDRRFAVVFEAIRRLTAADDRAPPRRRIGFARAATPRPVQRPALRSRRPPSS